MIRVRAAYSPVLVGCPCFARKAMPEEEVSTAGRPAVGVGQEVAPTPMLATVITAVIIAAATMMFFFAH